MKKLLETMRSFAGGQLNVGAKRRDDAEEAKTAARVMSDWRLEPSETLVPRPGRRLITSRAGARSEYARVGSTDYEVVFGAGSITICLLGSNLIAAQQVSGVYAWTAATLDQIYMCVCDFEIVICFPGMRPQLAVRAVATGAWTFGQFDFRLITQNSQQPFYRSGNLGAAIGYDRHTGAVNLTCSQPYFTPSMVGRFLSIIGQQVQITGVSSSTSATGNILYYLPDYAAITVDDITPFVAGQVCEIVNGANGGYPLKMEVDSVNPVSASAYPGATHPGQVIGPCLNAPVNTYYSPNKTDQLVSPLGAANVLDSGERPNGSTVQWQEQFMGDGLGWPQACAYDKSRLIFFDFPQKPEAILWSAIGQYDVFWIDSSAAAVQPDAGASPRSAILEFIVEGAPRVRHVIGWGDEFVFTDRGIYNIPIGASGNPLQPGSIEFRQFSNDGVSALKPVRTQDSIIYVNAGGTRASVVLRTGTITNQYATDGAADLHTDLFTGPLVLAVAPGNGPYPERLAYILNRDGTVIVGKFSKDRKFVGWMPWTSAAPPSWLFCSGPDVFYIEPHVGASWLVREDVTMFLDGALMPNAPLASLPAPPAGKGPYWTLAGQTATLMNGTQDLGDRPIDATGNIVAQAGDDWSSPGLVAGLLYQPKLQPFVSAPGPGESAGQRQRVRKISRAMVSAEISSGFTLGSRFFSPYRVDDDPTQPPPLRDQQEQVRPIGRSFDPGCLLVKDRPGPIRIVEYSTEVTI